MNEKLRLIEQGKPTGRLTADEWAVVLKAIEKGEIETDGTHVERFDILIDVIKARGSCHDQPNGCVGCIIDRATGGDELACDVAVFGPIHDMLIYWITGVRPTDADLSIHNDHMAGCRQYYGE